MFDRPAVIGTDATKRTGGGLFALLGVSARLGRTLTESDDREASGKVVVLSDRIWRRLFESDERVIGRVVQIGNDGYTIRSVKNKSTEPVILGIWDALCDRSNGKDVVFWDDGFLAEGSPISVMKGTKIFATISS